MKANLGKKFEQDVRSFAIKQGLWVLRIQDSDLSWAGGNTKFTKTNPCDCLIFDSDTRTLFMIEQKSTIHKNITIQTDPEQNTGMIKYHQICGLANGALHEGIEGVFLFNYRDLDETEEIIDEHTYIMSIQDFSDFLVETGKKSINPKDVENYGGILIPQRKSRKYFTYDIKEGIRLYLERSKSSGKEHIQEENND